MSALDTVQKDKEFKTAKDENCNVSAQEGQKRCSPPLPFFTWCCCEQTEVTSPCFNSAQTLGDIESSIGYRQDLVPNTVI